MSDPTDDSTDDSTPIHPDVSVGNAMPDDGVESHAPAGANDDDDPVTAMLGGGGGGAGGLDFGALMEQASNMQSQMLAAQEQAASTVVEGVSGGGAVRVAVSGTFEFQGVTIDPSAVNPDDVAMLQDLVLAALNDAMDQVSELQQGSMDLGGLDLGGLLGGD